MLRMCREDIEQPNQRNSHSRRQNRVDSLARDHQEEVLSSEGQSVVPPPASPRWAAIDQIKGHLIATARMTDHEARAFCKNVVDLAEQGQTFTAWEAFLAARQPLIVRHPGLRHAQTREAVHALMGPYLASGAYHVEPVHAGPGRDPLLYYADEPRLRSWLAARPG
jgi:hypothetical protein